MESRRAAHVLADPHCLLRFFHQAQLRYWSRLARVLQHRAAETLRRPWVHRAAQHLRPRGLDHRAVSFGLAVLVAIARRLSKQNCRGALSAVKALRAAHETQSIDAVASPCVP